MVELISENEGMTFSTSGLHDLCSYELSASVNDITLSDECEEFVQFILDYISTGNIIKDGELVSYGYWITKAVLSENSVLKFSELEPEAAEFIEGISNTVKYWKLQHAICEKASAEFSPLNMDQKIAISDGVYEGDPVSAVRYPAPPHMSGWYLTTGKYDGNISSLKVVHAHHVSAKRPDLAKYFALPYGYRFHSDDDSVWFDQKVAQQ